MAKRHVKKRKKRIRRLARLVGLLLLLGVAALVLFLALRPSQEGDGTTDKTAALWDGSWYEDELGRIEKDKALVEGMETFWKRTNARPFLTLLAGVDPEELDLFVQDQYDALFTDGGHVLVVYDEWEEGTYYLSARAGEGSGLSQEDVAYLLSAIETAYADPANASYAAAFGAGFSGGAQALSTGSRSNSGVIMLLVIGLLLILLSAILVLFLRKRARDARRWMVEDDG